MMGIFLMFGSNVFAQQNTSGNAQQKRKDTLIPVYQSILGNVLTSKLPASLMKKLLDSTLKARDKQGNVYRVVAFDIGYRQKETIINDTTGRPETTHDYLYWHFQGNKLDSAWRTKIQSELKSGDQLYFDHIIAADEKGNKYLSSPLHFKIE